MAAQQNEIRLMNVTGNDMTFYRLDWLSFVCNDECEYDEFAPFDMYISLLNDIYKALDIKYVATDDEVECKKGKFGYARMITDERTGVTIFDFPSKNYNDDTRWKMGTLVQFSGRFFDFWTGTPHDLCSKLLEVLKDYYNNRIRCTRLDVARDFFNSPFNMDYLNRFIDRACPDGYFYTAGKKWAPTIDIDNNKRIDTLYVGKRTNDKMLRFYDKLKQISKNGKIPVFDANGNEIITWTRYETEYHLKYSNNIFYSLATMDDFDVFAYANKHDAYNNYISALPYYEQSKWARENGDRKAEYDPVYKMKILYNTEEAREPVIIQEKLENPLTPTFIENTVVPYFISYSKAFGLNISDVFLSTLIEQNSVDVKAVKKRFNAIQEYMEQSPKNVLEVASMVGSSGSDALTELIDFYKRRLPDGS